MTNVRAASLLGLAGILLSAAPAATAQDGAALFASLCSGCHDDFTHPKGLVYNAAGKPAIIEAEIAFGMATGGTAADHAAIAAYLDSVKPTITLAQVRHDAATVIPLGDIIVSGAQAHASGRIIDTIVTVSPPTKGTVTYRTRIGFAEPSLVTYTPFPGASGVDTWTYQGIGAGGSTTVRTASVSIATGTTAVDAPDLDQHGLTGSWYEAATSGQGFEVEVFPDQSSPGTGLIQVSWFTYDTVAGGADRQRWYTLSGAVVSGQPAASLTIYRNTGGNFDAAPITMAQAVGTATLSFDTCTSGHLSYNFTDGSGRAGDIPLTRLTQNMTCSTDSAGARPVNADFALSGNWYDPATSGQGFTLEANPNSNTLFAAWYTYAPSGAGAGAAGQRWYTAQAGGFAAGTRTIPLQIFETTGGVFDAPTPAGQKSVAVGSATLAFQSCSQATFTYNFTGGSSTGMAGTISLRRVGPVPAGCAP
jgi:hypothetical protein